MNAHSDPYHLRRFVDAQGPVFDAVTAELRAGLKESHWMWFVFPQAAGLGTSALARKFAIASIAEAAAYLDHPLLGARLRECTRLINDVKGRAIDDILGYPDNLKFQSSMTLFARATTDNQVFLDALEKFFAGQQDRATLNWISAATGLRP